MGNLTEDIIEGGVSVFISLLKLTANDVLPFLCGALTGAAGLAWGDSNHKGWVVNALDKHNASKTGEIPIKKFNRETFEGDRCFVNIDELGLGCMKQLAEKYGIRYSVVKSEPDAQGRCTYNFIFKARDKANMDMMLNELSQQLSRLIKEKNAKETFLSPEKFEAYLEQIGKRTVNCKLEGKYADRFVVNSTSANSIKININTPSGPAMDNVLKKYPNAKVNFRELVKVASLQWRWECELLSQYSDSIDPITPIDRFVREGKLDEFIAFFENLDQFEKGLTPKEALQFRQDLDAAVKENIEDSLKSIFTGEELEAMKDPEFKDYDKEENEQHEEEKDGPNTRDDKQHGNENEQPNPQPKPKPEPSPER